MKENETEDKYFVETKAYKEGEETFHRYGIVIWTGPPGCGKTKAAIHLIMKQINREGKKCSFRLIRFPEELSYIEKNKTSLVLIDDIFSKQIMNSALNWWNELDRLHKDCFQNNEFESGTNRVRLIITARENVIDRACHSMGKTTPILNERFKINNNVLNGEEKENIFSQQCTFANKERNVETPDTDKRFLKDIKKAEGPISFPLCAHLFVFNKEYQKSGSHFFSYPNKYLKDEIKKEIEMDPLPKTKSLFLVLFFYEWQTKMGNAEKLELKNVQKCKHILENVARVPVNNFEQLDLNGLEYEAQRFIGSFLKEESMGSYRFVHDSVYEAVGAFLCESDVTDTARHFPLDIIQMQDYETATENELVILASRLISEAKKQKYSEVFACRLFHRDGFIRYFLSELTKSDDKTIKRFFIDDNRSSTMQFPCMFWTSFNKLTLLSKLLYDIVCEKNLDPEYQLYLLLLGECCAGNKYLLVDWMHHHYSEEIKRRVLSFRQNEDMCILHLVISSQKSDEFASLVVEKLLNDGLGVDVRTSRKMTPLMIAVNQRLPRTLVIKNLIKRSPKLICKDWNNSNVFHHCVSSCNDGDTCAKYLDILLCQKDAKACLCQNNTEGNIPLSVAAMEKKYSRIHSILLLLESGFKHKIKVGTLNKDGFSPLQLSVRSLKTESKFIELECCIRVVMFLLYGDTPDNRSDTDIQAIKECKYDIVKNILQKPKDQQNMGIAIKCILKKMGVEQREDNFAHLPTPSISMNKNVQIGIYQSIKVLKKLLF